MDGEETKKRNDEERKRNNNNERLFNVYFHGLMSIAYAHIE